MIENKYFILSYNFILAGGDIKMIINILTWLILGAVAGAIASWLTHSSNSLVMDIILGIVGAVVGGLVMNLFGQSSVSGLNLYSFVVAIIGSVIVVSIGKFVRKAA